VEVLIQTFKVHLLEDGKDKVVHMHAMKIYRGLNVYLHSPLTLTLDGGKQSASSPGFCFNTGQSASSTHYIGCWVVSRVSLDVLEMEQSLSSAGDRALDRPAHSLVPTLSMLS
jgi:hypothetical protein